MSVGVAFRVDATARIGTGHFMRCLTLADVLRRQGMRTRFISRSLPDHLREMLVVKGMALTALSDGSSAWPTDELAHASWLGATQAQDAQDTAQALAGEAWDWLVVDHYALDARWERPMRSVVPRILCIDDLADRQHDCDVLLDQNHYRDMSTRYAGKVPPDCHLLLGPRYALLRDEFRQLRQRTSPRTGQVRRILVFFGGIDAGNHTGQAIQALSDLSIDGMAVDVVIGLQHPQRAEIEQACQVAGHACHVQTPRMAELTAAADLAIAAGGAATWERCCLGLPTLSISTANNQTRQIADAAEAGLLYAPSSIGSDLVDLIGRHTKCLLENAPLLQRLSSAAMQAVDGLGALRVANLMRASQIDIRCAVEDDSANLFEWRNHPSIRAASRTTGLIDWDAHCAWFASVLGGKDRSLLIGYIGNAPMGVVRFDLVRDEAEVSIYLVPQAGFEGQGRNLLLAAERWLVAERPGIRQVCAEVLGANTASQRLFQGADYRAGPLHYWKELKGRR